jgi:sugar/nucleoside kinase (ribokinase family)
VDTTGAGDAYNGGFLWAWLNGLSPRQCLAAGSAVGAASVRKPGGLEGLPHRIKVPRMPGGGTGARGARGNVR